MLIEEFREFLDSIDELEKRKRMEDILNHIKKKFPQLKGEIKWNQPMFSDHGAFIVAISIAKGHIAVAPELKLLAYLKKRLKKPDITACQIYLGLDGWMM